MEYPEKATGLRRELDHHLRSAYYELSIQPATSPELPFHFVLALALWRTGFGF